MAFGQKKKKYESSHDVKWLVVGLGNVGSRYDNTPHNVGFQVVDGIAKTRHTAFISKFDGQYGVCSIDGSEDEIALLKPMTYMNLSGNSVKPAVRKLNISLDNLIVIHDEIDLPFGEVRVKMGGGLAGHNGLKSISTSISTQEFIRVRVGVGRPRQDDRRPIRDWILSSWDQNKDEVDGLVLSAKNAVELIICDGLHVAMNMVNTQVR